MSKTGTLHVIKPSYNEINDGAVALILIYGPNGGTVGSVLIDREDAERAHKHLGELLIKVKP